MVINIIRHSNKFVKFLIYLVFIVSITNSALSTNLKEIRNSPQLIFRKNHKLSLRAKFIGKIDELVT